MPQDGLFEWARGGGDAAFVEEEVMDEDEGEGVRELDVGWVVWLVMKLHI